MLHFLSIFRAHTLIMQMFSSISLPQLLEF